MSEDDKFQTAMINNTYDFHFESAAYVTSDVSRKEEA